MLTDRAVAAAVKRGRQRVLIDSTGERGSGRLALRVVGPGKAAWVGRWQEGGRRRSVTIGHWPGMDLAGAREAFAGRVAEALQAGQEPGADNTVAGLFRAYVADMRRQGKRSADEVERALLTSPTKAAAELIGADRPAVSVTASDLSAILGPIYRRAPSSAGHLRAYLAAAFAYGMRADHDYRQASSVRFGLTGNPAACLPAVPVRARSRVLTPAELRDWWHGFPEHAAQRTVAVLRLVLLTCSRPSEAMEAQKADLRVGEWVKPRTKNGRQHMTPLHPLAKAEALVLRDTTGGSLQGLSRAVARWCEHAGCEPWQPRDLRRTARTWLSEAGEEPGLLDLHFNHGAGAGVVKKHYDLATRWADRVALAQRWQAMVLDVIEGAH